MELSCVIGVPIGEYDPALPRSIIDGRTVETNRPAVKSYSPTRQVGHHQLDRPPTSSYRSNDHLAFVSSCHHVPFAAIAIAPGT